MSVVTPPPRPATLDDLMRVEGKAELIRGRIVTYMASGDLPSVNAFRIARKLADFVDDHGIGHRGRCTGTDMGFAVAHLLLASGRQSFSPDASYYTGRRPTNPLKFVTGPPDFAVEVRSDVRLRRPGGRRRRWPTSGLTTSRPAPWWSGTWTR